MRLDRAEDLGLLRGELTVARNDGNHMATLNFYTQTQRRHVHQNQVPGIGSADRRPHRGLPKDASLDGCPCGNCLIRIHRVPWELRQPEEVLDEVLDLGYPSAAPNQDHLVDVLWAQPRVLEDSLHKLQSLGEELCIQMLKLRAREFFGEIETLKKSFHFYLCLHGDAQSSFGPLHCNFQLLNSARVL
mmetsp:Transcript_3199/g.4961  ORF Transcript_3199/g.4961 Transcript_3199/m.4961 type:complete len:188 (-) Transcript_3199:478-1041(-)